MDFPTEEYLTEKVAKAIINNAEYASSSEERDLMFEEEQPYWNDVAEAVIKALVKALPDIPSVTQILNGHYHTSIDVYKLEEYYQQLKDMGR